MSYNQQPNTQEIPNNWGAWKWDATSIGTTAALCGTLFVMCTMLCIIRCRRNLRIARSQLESAGAPVDVEAVNTASEKVADDEKTISESPVFEKPFIPMPLAAYFPRAYWYYEDAEEGTLPVYSPQRESHRY